MTPFNLEQALAGKPFTNDKGWTVEDWHYFKGADYPIAIKWKDHHLIWFYTGPELFMLPEKKKVWIVVYILEDGLILSSVFTDKSTSENWSKGIGNRHLETIEKEYEL